MRHRLQRFIHLQAHGLRKGDEHLAYTPRGYDTTSSGAGKAIGRVCVTWLLRGTSRADGRQTRRNIAVTVTARRPRRRHHTRHQHNPALYVASHMINSKLTTSF